MVLYLCIASQQDVSLPDQESLLAQGEDGNQNIISIYSYIRMCVNYCYQMHKCGN